MDNQQQEHYIYLDGKQVKLIKGTKDYFVSRCGKVYSTRGKEVRQLKCGLAKGYPSLSIYSTDGVRKSARVHRLVAEAYIPNLEGKELVNHINGIKTDNRVENLEWATYRENMNHAYSTGLIDNPRLGTDRRMLTEEQVLEIYHRCLGDEERKAIADEYDIDESTLADIISRRNWGHLTKDLPDVSIRPKAVNFSEEEVKLICYMLQNREKSSKIYDAIGRDRLTRFRLFDIKNRRVYQDISKDYVW